MGIIMLGLTIGVVTYLFVVLFGYATRSFRSNEAVNAVKAKVLHVADKDYPLRELILLWNANTRKLTTDGAKYHGILAQGDSTWTARDNSDQTYSVSTTRGGREYIFNFNASSKEITPANDIAREIFSLPNWSFGSSN